MRFLAILTSAQLKEMVAPKFTPGSLHKMLFPLAVIGLGLTGYFAWLYYHEWQMRRKFRRYWEGKSRKDQK